MACANCIDLDRTFGEANERYVIACRSAFYRVCAEVAAKREVDMERAKTALEEHRAVCPSAALERGGA